MNYRPYIPIKKAKKKRHSWKQEDGFRKYSCNVPGCGCRKEWDNVRKMMVYYNKFGNGPFFFSPECVEPKII